ncbi:MAG: TRAP transporter small permease [Proteobacteria bacterium]|nr:MAG: TRAP transporter small permease [Pseudomonadota bacterium]
MSSGQVSTGGERRGPGSIALCALRWLDANLEKTIIFVAYVACAGIIAVEVVRRFLLNEQVAWSTTVPSYMFIWLTWPGAALGVRMRAHLSFGEFRNAMPRIGQYIAMQVDYVLYLVFAVVAVYYSYDLLGLQIQNFSTVPGTFTLPSWWFYLATPVGWSLLVLRVIQNAVEDFNDMRTGRPLKTSGGLGNLD